MSRSSTRRRARRAAVALGVLLAASTIGACAEVETDDDDGYEPAHVEPRPDGDGSLVQITAEGVRRTGLRTGRVGRRGDRLVIPYEALLYDGTGQGLVYVETEPRTYVRAPIEVDRVASDRVLLTDGPPAGSTVVTVGASEVYGTELGIAGGH